MFEVLAIVTMTVGNLGALTQTNLKRMLAYSSIAHAGLRADRRRRGTARGVSAMLIYLLIYSFMQLARSRDRADAPADVVGDELKDFSGLHQRTRSPRSRCCCSCCRSAAFRRPPVHGQVLALQRAIDAQYYWLALIGVLNSAISLYYYIRIVVFMYVKKETLGSEPASSPSLTVACGRRRGDDCAGCVSASFDLAEPRRHARAGVAGITATISNNATASTTQIPFSVSTVSCEGSVFA